MPVLFIAHGSPMIALGNSAYTRFFDQEARSVPASQAIAMFSAHWENTTPSREWRGVARDHARSPCPSGGARGWCCRM